MAIRIDSELCVGCGLCQKACLYDAIDLVDRKASLKDTCVHCGACVESCSFQAIISETSEGRGKDLSAYKGVMVFAETRGNRTAKVGLELLGCGRRLADELGVPLHAVLIGAGVSALVAEVTQYGADVVHVVEDPKLNDYVNGPYSKALATVIQKQKPEIVLIGATISGRDLAPRVANRLKTGLTADCTRLDIEEGTGLLLQTRPAFGGNVMATIACPNHRPQMSTVRPGVMKPISPQMEKTSEFIEHHIELGDDDFAVMVREVLKSVEKHLDLSEAEIIVSGGRGLGGPNGFKYLKELADCLGGEVGASRAAVDAGWIDHDHQVGQTGKSVSPKLYVACGISGAIQHLAGIAGADFVIAVNKDAEAPIMKAADVAMVGDLYKIVPLLVSEIQKSREAK